MRLSELVSGSGFSAQHTGAEGDPTISDITFDSRLARPGTLFVALVGEAADGHEYVHRAVAAGAPAVMINASCASEFDGLTVPVILVDDTRRRLGSIAATVYAHPARDLNVIGITGTNGKTTVSFLIEAVLSHAGKAPGVLGTVSYRWPGHVEDAPNTTPESVIVQRMLAQMRADGVDTVAMEVSSHGLATHRLEGTNFDVAIFTNLSQDHLDFHADMEEYRAAKRTLFTEHLRGSAHAGKHPVAVLNVDDPEGRALAALDLGNPAVTTSADGQDATWSCTSWSQSVDGAVMEVSSPMGKLSLTTQLLGRFNASNVLQTLAATHLVGADVHLAIEALRDLRGVPGRLEHLGGGDRPHVFVDYAHTPDALESALHALRPLTFGRLIAVFGCGGNRDRDKREKMGAVAAAVSDFVVLTSDNPRSEEPMAIIEEIERGMSTTDFTKLADRADAIRHAVAVATADDVILIAGKGHETYQEIAGERRPFDDMAQARAALDEWA